MPQKPTAKPNIDFRQWAELRATDEQGEGFSGYASHFWSVDSYYTAVAKGAFRRTIGIHGDRTPILWQHDGYAPIGRPTLLKEDKTGLKFDAEIVPETRQGAEALALLRAGVPLGMSFGFETLKSRPATEDDPLDFTQYKAKPEDVTVIEEVRLWEISLVTFPANQMAAINDVRAVAEADALTSLIEHVRGGTLTDEHAALVADLVTAWQERADPDPDPIEGTTPLAAEQARRRNRDIEITLALASAKGWIGAAHA